MARTRFFCAYTAALIRPLPFKVVSNVGFALALAGLAVAFESRLREGKEYSQGVVGQTAAGPQPLAASGK